jgi:putative transposase
MTRSGVTIVLKFSTQIRAVNLQSAGFTGELEKHGIKISMNGRGRFQDNIFVERLWWTVKHHYVYLRTFDSGTDLRKSLKRWFDYYNQERSHQSLGDQTPDEVYFKERKWLKAA